MIPRCGGPGTAGDGYRCPALDDISEARRLDDAEHRALAEAVDLLEFNPHRSALLRLSLHDWRRAENVRDALAAARTPPAIPTPRPVPTSSPAGAL